MVVTAVALGCSGQLNMEKWRSRRKPKLYNHFCNIIETGWSPVPGGQGWKLRGSQKSGESFGNFAGWCSFCNDDEYNCR